MPAEPRTQKGIGRRQSWGALLGTSPSGRSFWRGLAWLLCVALAACGGSSSPPPAAGKPQPAPGSDPISELRKYLGQPPEVRGVLRAQPFATQALTEAQATQARRLLWSERSARLRRERSHEFAAKRIELDGYTLKYDYTRLGPEPATGRSLFVSLHGGGNTAPETNTAAWHRHKTRYPKVGLPEEGVYLAPRAPTDTWNMWHQEHVDGLLDRLITDMVLFERVNANRVYLMGYSAGGDGTYQLAPRMADRWAAAAMSAGHPNDAKPLGLRNIGFALHMGAEDSAYNRNRVARQWGRELEVLHRDDPTGYAHQVQIHEGKAHWMEMQDAVAIPWMAGFTRNLTPKKIAWYQDDVLHNRFYWLAVDDANKVPGKQVHAAVEGQQIKLSADGLRELRVRLSDALVDLDRPVLVTTADGSKLFHGPVKRTIAVLAHTLDERLEPNAMFDAELTLALAKPAPPQRACRSWTARAASQTYGGADQAFRACLASRGCMHGPSSSSSAPAVSTARHASRECYTPRARTVTAESHVRVPPATRWGGVGTMARSDSPGFSLRVPRSGPLASCNLSCQGVEAVSPKSTKTGKPLVKLLQRCRIQGVQATRAVDAHVGEPMVP